MNTAESERTYLKAVGVLGSPRKESNTEILLNHLLSKLGSYGISCMKLRLRDYEIRPCYSCRKCLELGNCCIKDDMTEYIIPHLLQAHIIIIASPVYFDNVSALTKVFMDRTWCLRGKLRNKILGCIVVGRGYGLDSALVAIHNWGLKHKMIIGDRGVVGIGFEYGDILSDARAFKDAGKHAERLAELAKLIYGGSNP
ncbi:MAG: NADPH-dependent FMN reductase [Desulfurococcales archaeon ex4484_42]|nr:MAG: NADPH-dependent FMN reductase [Desulfurococcales archaeon ex4484_42]